MTVMTTSLYKNIRRYLLVHWKKIGVALLFSFALVALAPLSLAIFGAVMQIVLGNTEVGTGIASGASLLSLQIPWGFDLKKWIGYFNDVSICLIAQWGRQQLVFVLCLIFLVLNLITKAMGILSQYLLWDVRCKAAQSMSQDIFRHVCNLSMDFFDRTRVGELISRLNSDAYLLGKHLYNIVTALLQSLPVAILFWFVLFQTNFQFTLIVIAVFSATVLVSYQISLRIRHAIVSANNALGDMGAFMQETFSGIAVVKAYNAEAFEHKRFSFALSENIRCAIRMGALERINKPMEDMIYSVALSLIVIYSLSLILSGNMQTSTLVLYVYVLSKVRGPTSDLLGIITDVQSALGAANKIFQILQERSSVTEGALASVVFAKEIQFRGLSFGYGQDDLVLKDVDLTIRKGEMVAVVGSSGAGKSTLINLILRFYDPTEGAILLDGVDIRQYRQKPYRHLFGVVTQETILFNATVRDNIAYGREGDDICAAEIINAAKAANAHDFISEMENGYDTFIGDRGVRLSGGQCQRLAIARAVLRDPLILIFDEATSSLDSESERLVQDAIDRLLKGRTAIIIAHRLSTIRKADRIVVLDKGRIVEEGTHDQLLANSGLYRRLNELQFNIASGPNGAHCNAEKR